MNEDISAALSKAIENRLKQQARVDEYVRVHAERMSVTMRTIMRVLPDRGAWDILEAGGASMFTTLLQEFLPQHRVSNTTEDLRYPLSNADCSADLILSCEVLEHIKDQNQTMQPEDWEHKDRVLALSTFNFSGIKCHLKECYRILRPGGTMVVTTPNACSALVINNAVNGRPPAMYRPHVREYTPDELVHLLLEAGFEMRWDACTREVWRLVPASQRTHVEDLVKSRGKRLDLLDDDLFAVVMKP